MCLVALRFTFCYAYYRHAINDDKKVHGNWDWVELVGKRRNGKVSTRCELQIAKEAEKERGQSVKGRGSGENKARELVSRRPGWPRRVKDDHQKRR